MKRFLILTLLLLAITDCKAGSSNPSSLKLPEIPSGFVMPQERATYLALHFWDNVGFSVDSLDYSKPLIDQNFADYITLFPILTDQDRSEALESLLRKASSGKEAFTYISEIAEKYLYEPQSPVYNEDYFKIFLEKMLKTDMLDENERIRPLFLYEEIMKNYPGDEATDILFETISGEKKHLREIKTNGDILLVFFDPDCDHCRQAIDEIKTNPLLTARIDSGMLTVLAIYSGDEKAMWMVYASSLPESWIIGYEPGEIFDEGLYSIRTFPTLYLLDPEHKVIKRNFELSQL